MKDVAGNAAAVLFIIAAICALIDLVTNKGATVVTAVGLLLASIAGIVLSVGA